MLPVFKLRNQIKHYAWGDPLWIPTLLGEKNPDNKPCAELWMGIHPEGVSEAELPDHTVMRLDKLIAQEPSFYLGASLSFLPFLLKTLAAGKPLSIQAHPSLEQAKAGFERENKAGIHITAPERNYKDANHKPEIICALTPFRAMAGFREPAEIRNLLEIFDFFHINGMEGLKTALNIGLEPFLRTLFCLSQSTCRAISDYILTEKQEIAEKHPEFKDILETAASFAELYYSDPAVLSPCYLNLITLSPGQAVFLPAGILHAYIYGLGVELMANSDNVLRGGLTPKHIDLEELFKILDFSPFKPDILYPNPVKYPSKCREFALSVLKEKQEFPENGPAIVIVTQGEVSIRGEDGELILKQGESAFVAANNKGKLFLDGNFTLFVAGTGEDC